MRKYNTIAIALHRRCSISCRSCCFGCTPRSFAKIPKRLVKSIIKQSAEIPEIKIISITGGEPFFDINYLIEVFYWARLAGKHSKVITNASWAENYNETVETIRKCKMFGLIKLGVSVDRYHQEYVPIEKVNNVLMACQELGLRANISVRVLKGDKIGELLLGLDESLHDLNIEVGSCHSVGSAKTNFSKDMFFMQILPEDFTCGNIDTMFISFDGKVYPCCNYWIEKTGMCVGNIRNISLKEIFSILGDDEILFFIRNLGFGLFIQYAKKIGVKLPKKGTSYCELCSCLFGKKNIEKFSDFAKMLYQLDVADLKKMLYEYGVIEMSEQK